jgi:hypothetical protein
MQNSMQKYACYAEYAKKTMQKTMPNMRNYMLKNMHEYANPYAK